MRCRHLILFAFLLTATPATATAAQPVDATAPMLCFSAGQLGIFDSHFGDPLEFGLALRFRPVGK